MSTQSQLKRTEQRDDYRKHCRDRECARIANETRIAITGATEVHRALCAPESQKVAGFEIACRVVPARHVGGDFICSFEHAGKTFALLGDLMGKGLSAAMWVTHTIDLMHRAAEGSRNVCELLRQLNLEILNSRVRAPLFSAIGVAIDHRTGMITCAAAGHPPAIILRSNSRPELTTVGGPLLGAFSCAKYSCQQIRLSAGESIVLFSDGLIEACNDEYQEFTLDRAQKVLSESAALSPSDKISRLLDASMCFSGENPLDDVSLMVVQRA